MQLLQATHKQPGFSFNHRFPRKKNAVTLSYRIKSPNNYFSIFDFIGLCLGMATKVCKETWIAFFRCLYRSPKKYNNSIDTIE